MDLELKGRIALVTGASVGIGRGIAPCLAAEGARLAVTARRTALLDELADEIATSDAERPLVVTADLYEKDAPQRIRDAVLDRFGGLDILVNNAGGSRPMSFDSADEEWDESFALNFTAARRLTQAVLATMREQRWGRIINITGTDEPKSMNAGPPANAATHVWAKAMSKELGPEGITMNSVVPGRIMSEQIVERLHPTEESRRAFTEANIPLGYFGEPEDLAVVVAFLASPRARYITGQVIYCDGGTRSSPH